MGDTTEPDDRRERLSRRLFLTRCAAGGVAAVGALGVLDRCRRLRPTVRPTSVAARETLDRVAGEDPAAAKPRPLPPREEPTVRIRIGAVREADRPVTIGSDHPLVLRRPESSDRAQVLNAPVAVAIAAGGWSIVDATGFRAATSALEPVRLEPHVRVPTAPGPEAIISADAPPPHLVLNDRRYPGALVLHARTEEGPAAFDIVNHVDLEAYLPGVLARELYGSWHARAFAAQAVAARSYAICEAAFFRDRRHFDLHDSQASQAYIGRVEHRPSIEAVTATRGMILTFDQRVVPCYYSSCCGGVAARAVDAISASPINDIEPLHGHGGEEACAFSPRYRWSVDRSLTEVTRRLIAYGKHHRHDALPRLVAIAAIEPAEVNVNGRPISYDVTDRAGLKVRLAAPHLRRALNYVGQGFRRPKQPAWSGHLERVRADARMIAIDGCGFGHGAGMCQYGAQGRAKAGAAFDDILAFYYPGAEGITAYR